MDVFDAARTVLAVRAYQDRPIPGDVLRRVVEAGRLTGSASNDQPWHFVVVTDELTLRSIGQAAKTGRYIAQAPAAVVVAIRRGNALAVSDASRAVQSMVLTAWDAGVGSNWVGFRGLEAVAQLLNVPDSYEVLAVVPLGYPAQERRLGRKSRKPLGDVASANRFGDPLP